MKPGRAIVASWALAVAWFVLAGALYSRLPDPVPTHWNLRGEADGFSPKPLGPFIIPLFLLVTCVVLPVLPRISPKDFGMPGPVYMPAAPTRTWWLSICAAANGPTSG